MPATTTKLSLLLRLRDSRDADAWATFVAIYGPIVHRYGLRSGLQDADSADLVQNVFREVTRRISDFDYNPDIGRFRNWLLTVAQFSVLNMRRAGKRQPIGTGDTHTVDVLKNYPDVGVESDEFWEQEFQQRLFEWAAEQVRPQVKPQTWQAFWITAVEGKSSAEAARQLSMKVGSVYVARNRVLARLRKKISEVEGE